MITYKTKIKPMDIIIVYNKRSWLHRLIYGITDMQAGHIALYLGDGIICEANSTGIHRKPWKNYNDNMLVYLARCKIINETRGILIRRFCWDMENRKYAFGQLIVMALKYLFRLSHVPDVSKKAMICSEFVANAMLAGDINLCPGKAAHEITPGDILKSSAVWVIKGWE
jgi:hypothetical protein